jgi:hypothetical protein
MKYKIHHDIGEVEDSIIIEADTIDEIRELANKECQIKRGWKYGDCWSEKINEPK